MHTTRADITRYQQQKKEMKENRLLDSLPPDQFSTYIIQKCEIGTVWTGLIQNVISRMGSFGCISEYLICADAMIVRLPLLILLELSSAHVTLLIHTLQPMIHLFPFLLLGCSFSGISATVCPLLPY